MADADLGALMMRMVVSLFVVLAIVFGAYAVLRRRRTAGFAPRPRAAARRGRTATPRGGLRVLARTGLGRNVGVSVVQFADRVLLIGASEQGAPRLLAEMTLDDWAELTAPVEELSPIEPVGELSTAGAASAPPGLLAALREATTRRA